MRIKNLLQLVVVLVLGQFLFSCNSAEYYKFTPDKPEAYNTAKPKPAPEVKEAQNTMPSVAKNFAIAEEKEINTVDPVFEANAAKKPVATAQKSSEVVKAPVVTENVDVEKRDISVEEAEMLALAKERLATMTKAEKKELKKEVKEVMRKAESRTSIVEVILAILLPPLAVFLHDGIGTSFWVNIILTLLFVIPGIVHALLVVTDTI